MLYRYRASIPWWHLPAHFGYFHGVHTSHSQWCHNGVLQGMFADLAQDADKAYAMIDAVVARPPAQCQYKTDIRTSKPSDSAEVA